MKPFAPAKCRFLPAFAISSLAALAAACAGAAADVGVGANQFQDMVVPEGFRLLDDSHQSHSREAGDWRFGKFCYRGSVAIADAVAYLKQRMPQHGWVSEAEDLQPTEGKLRFARGRYVADYHFTRQEGSTSMVVDYLTDYSRR